MHGRLNVKFLFNIWRETQFNCFRFHIFVISNFFPLKEIKLTTSEYSDVSSTRINFTLLPFLTFRLVLSFHGATSLSGSRPPHYPGFAITPHSVGLPWANDHPDAETST